MQLTRAADYGVRVMVRLATLPAGSRTSLPELAASVDVPPVFLSKVLQRLVKSGLVASRRGKQGGFELACDAASVTLYDVLEALDSVPWLNQCVGTAAACDRSPCCAAHLVWIEAQERMREVLTSASLERMARLGRARERLA
ncbi:MAG: RrF2 family transcriptional regulator [Bacteroidales bacterium]